MEKKRDQEENIEFGETLLKLKLDIRSTRIMLLVFGVLAGALKIIFQVPLSTLILVLILAWFLLYFGYEYLVNRIKKIEKLYNLYFGYNIFDLFILTIIIYYLGGAEWIGFVFYILIILLSGLIAFRKRTIILSFIALSFYICLILLEYFGIIPYRSLFLLKPDIFQSPSYLVTQIAVLTALFYFVAKTAGDFSETLKEKTKRLIETGAVLEIKVRARTKELQELTENQEKAIKERTEELQGKIIELEKFQKLAIGRELKMTELKEEIKILKEKLDHLGNKK